MPTWKDNLRRAATEWLALPPETVLDAPRLVWVDGGEVVVENIVSLIEVTEQQIRVDAGQTLLILTGHQFEVTFVRHGELRVTGELHDIRFERRPST